MSVVSFLRNPSKFNSLTDFARMSLHSSAPFCADSLLLINESCVTHRLRDDHLRHSLNSVDFEPSKEEKERQGDTERRLSGMTDPKDEPEPGRKDKEVSYRVNCLYSL